MPVRGRTFDLTIGYGSLGLFLASIAVLIWFLLAGVNRGAEDLGDVLGRSLRAAAGGRGNASATYNALLVLAWGFLHSLLARPRLKQALARRIPDHYVPAAYALIASAGLILLCVLYRPIPRVVYVLDGGPALLVRLLFWAAWVLFAWCWFHLDLLEVVGLRPIRQGAGDAAPAAAAPFRPGGPFLWVRHPVELAFLVAFWAAPMMTVGHLLFAAVMTLYTFIGIDLEDRKMLGLGGPEYADYIRRVPQIVPFPR
jgi:protein-S-isoprenylcysteine O-methyltransferase Ste14